MNNYKYLGCNMDITGYKFKKLTAVRYHSKVKSRKRWLCLCDCGKEVIVIIDKLFSGHTKSCGCLAGQTVYNRKQKENEKEIGLKYGDWTIVGLSSKKGGYIKAKCICGTERDVILWHLKKGNSTNCGCLANEETSKRCLKDIVGQVFGFLTVIGRNLSRRDSSGKHSFWICRCECGKELSVNKGHLLSGRQKSCGCKNNSVSESLCREVFEQTFGKPFPKRRPDFLKNPKTGCNLELDGYNEELKLAFEYDGEYHYKSHWGRRGQSIEQRTTLDQLKDSLCQKEGITLIRIPFIQKNNMKEFILEQINKN
jgi:hypothetical protein